MERVNKMKKCIGFLAGNSDHHDIINNNQVRFKKLFVICYSSGDIFCFQRCHDLLHSPKISPVAIFKRMVT